MLAGSNPGVDVVNFRFHITDINASLQSSSVVSVENDQLMPCGNKGEIVTEKTTKQIQERKHKCNKCGSEDLLLANDRCDECNDTPQEQSEFGKSRKIRIVPNKEYRDKVTELEKENHTLREVIVFMDSTFKQIIDENKKLKEKMAKMEEEKTDFGAEIMNDYDAEIDKMEKRIAELEAEEVEEEVEYVLQDGSGFEFKDQEFQHFWCAGSNHVEIWKVPNELMQLKNEDGDSRVMELFREGCFGEEWGNVEEFTYRKLDLACLELTEKENGMDEE